jgi:hypothetical protein
MTISREDIEKEYCTGCQELCPERLYESTESRILHQQSHDRPSSFVLISELRRVWEVREGEFWDAYVEVRG